MKSLDPRDHDWVNNSTIYSWRQHLKSELLIQRGYVSDYSGIKFSPFDMVDMHEGIVSRAVVPKSVWWHYYLYHPYNCFLLTREEHTQYGHKREWAIQRSYELYGRENVVCWFEELPFKVRPFKLL